MAVGALEEETRRSYSLIGFRVSSQALSSGYAEVREPDAIPTRAEDHLQRSSIELEFNSNSGFRVQGSGFYFKATSGV